MGVGNKTPSFLSKFPLGKTPAFESGGEDGIYLTESNAIAYYSKRKKENRKRSNTWSLSLLMTHTFSLFLSSRTQTHLQSLFLFLSSRTQTHLQSLFLFLSSRTQTHLQSLFLFLFLSSSLSEVWFVGWVAGLRLPRGKKNRQTPHIKPIRERERVREKREFRKEWPKERRRREIQKTHTRETNLTQKLLPTKTRT